MSVRELTDYEIGFARMFSGHTYPIDEPKPEDYTLQIIKAGLGVMSPHYIFHRSKRCVISHLIVEEHIDNLRVCDYCPYVEECCVASSNVLRKTIL